MGCFLNCFCTSKYQKSRKPPNIITPGDPVIHETYEALRPSASIKQEHIEKPINPITQESKDEHEEQLNSRKKVTFDLNVKTYEDFTTHEVTDCSAESDEEKERQTKEETAKEGQSFSDSSAPSLMSYPSNHRYQNCESSDDEYKDDDDEGFNDEDDGKGGGDLTLEQEESSESLFSLSIESKKQVSVADTGNKEVNSPMPICGSPNRVPKTIGLNRNTRDRGLYVHSMLNPVENVTQWKVVKARATTPFKDEAKENINLEQELNIPFSPEPSFKVFTRNSKPISNHPKPLDLEIAVDTSLSSWLVESETTPNTKNISTNSVGNSSSERTNSLRSHEDRPILGALTVEDIKQFSASSSPRRSPNQSPEDIPILGTVGSYWSHTGQTIDSNSGSSCKGVPNTRSKHREEKRVNLHSIPFETRLERALD